MNAIAVVIAAASYTMITHKSNIRAVELLSILVLGVAMGALITNFAHYIRLKKETGGK